MAAARTALVWGAATVTTDAATAGTDIVPAPVPSGDVVAVDQPAARSRRALRAARTAVAPEVFELIEPPIVDEAGPVEEPVVDEPVRSESVDEFEAAARLFSFTDETPVMSAPEPADTEAEPVAAHVAPRGARRGRAAFSRVAATSFSFGVMGVVGLLTVGLTTPAEAVIAAGGSSAAAMSVRAPVEPAEDETISEIQAYVAPSSVQNADVTRDESYSTITMAELAYQSGITNISDFFVNDANAAIQWPFAVGVPISYGYGMRSGRMHQGVDFTPGAGAPIQAITDGTVRVATNNGGAYGVHVIIDHEIDGQMISSHYAHMILDSIQVVPGQKIEVGTVIGRTGNTGRSFGAHLHFELLLNGTTHIDPLPWLREHAGG